jgi:hypothetical protein
MNTSDTSRDGDRAILELAAKAVGIELLPHTDGWFPRGPYRKVADGNVRWNPLELDGDALRLAVKLQIIVGKYDEYANAGAISSDVDVVVWNHEVADPYAATRRAIVLCAASIATSALSETKGVA